jgi:hypothetical protein
MPERKAESSVRARMLLKSVFIWAMVVGVRVRVWVRVRVRVSVRVRVKGKGYREKGKR